MVPSLVWIVGVVNLIKGLIMDFYVYFVQKKDSPNSPIKVGHTTNLKRRLRSLQTGNPHKLEVRAAIVCGSRDDAAKLERSIHWIAEKKFRRLEGEWFMIHGSWKKLIEQAMKSSGKNGERLGEDQLN